MGDFLNYLKRNYLIEKFTIRKKNGRYMKMIVIYKYNDCVIYRNYLYLFSRNNSLKCHRSYSLNCLSKSDYKHLLRHVYNRTNNYRANF